MLSFARMPIGMHVTFIKQIFSADQSIFHGTDEHAQIKRTMNELDCNIKYKVYACSMQARLLSLCYFHAIRQNTTEPTKKKDENRFQFIPTKTIEWEMENCLNWDFHCFRNREEKKYQHIQQHPIDGSLNRFFF